MVDTIPDIGKHYNITLHTVITIFTACICMSISLSSQKCLRKGIINMHEQGSNLACEIHPVYTYRSYDCLHTRMGDIKINATIIVY